MLIAAERVEGIEPSDAMTTATLQRGDHSYGSAPPNAGPARINHLTQQSVFIGLRSLPKFPRCRHVDQRPLLHQLLHGCGHNLRSVSEGSRSSANGNQQQLHGGEAAVNEHLFTIPPSALFSILSSRSAVFSILSALFSLLSSFFLFPSSLSAVLS